MNETEDSDRRLAAGGECDGHGQIATTSEGQLFAGHSCTTINISGYAQVQLGDRFYPSRPPDEAQRIAASLHFPEILRRFESIEDAHSDTFEWIFEPPNDKQRRWSSFIDWLKDDNQVYWVSGKPGSGKSTLMKFMVERILTSNYEGQLKPVVLSFWFWEPGCDLERSLNGCIRSLLSQFVQCEQTRTVALQTILPHTGVTWTRRRLVDCLRTLLKKVADTPILLFLDGLDEASKDKEALLETIKTLKRDVPTLKMCVSSRPEQVFIDGFSDGPNLRVQDLNAEDISLVIQEDLFGNPKVAKNLWNEDQRNLKYLEFSIIEKAEGVFLWVKLVVSSLVRGLRNYDNIDILQCRLEELPGDLDDLYNLMLQRGNTDNQHYEQQASRYLNLALHRPMGLVEFCLAINDNLRKKYLSPETGWDMSTVDSDLQCEQAIVWINARCAGLLEVHPYECCRFEPNSSRLCYEVLAQLMNKYGESQVRFIHRTARTYILGTSTGKKLLASFHEGSIPLAQICSESKLVLDAVLKILPLSNITPGSLDSYYDERHYYYCRCPSEALNEDYERICNGILDVGNYRVDQFWWPGIGPANEIDRQCPLPSYDHNTIDFCRLYCLFGLWDSAQEKLNEGMGNLSIEKLSILLVFVAAGCLASTTTCPPQGPEFFRSLIELGANANHEIINHNDERICLFPYIIMWFPQPIPSEFVPLLKTIPDPPFENLPMLSSCSETFWLDTKWRTQKGSLRLFLWGDYSHADMAELLDQSALYYANASPSRIYVVYDARVLCGLPKLYPISPADSEQLLAALEKTDLNLKK